MFYLIVSLYDLMDVTLLLSLLHLAAVHVLFNQLDP
jgi:hypothetical protein